MKKAVVIGGTGATGRRLIQQLIKSDDFKSVTSIGRRPVLEGKSHEKLLDVIIDSFDMLKETEDAWKGSDVFFNCIGTTRQKAGGARQFVDVELGISRLAATMASEANIPHASVISASGANHKGWAVDWIHPLLYTKTIGQKEQTVITENNFKRVSIFRPGMLLRLMDSSQWYDSLIKTMGIGLRVDILSQAMINDSLNPIENYQNYMVKYIIGNKEITELARKNN
mgnify:CR=1 FL=1